MGLPLSHHITHIATGRLSGHIHAHKAHSRAAFIFGRITQGIGLSRTGTYHLSYAMVAVLCVIGIILVSRIDETRIGK